MRGTIDENLLDIILPKEGLNFREDFGKIKFTYAEKVEEGCYREIHEVVPSDVVKSGKQSILDYANQKIEGHKAKWKRQDEIEESIRKNHIPIKTRYKGMHLEGRIVEAVSRYIRVELDKPLQEKSIINFGFGSAMIGHYVFTEKHEISEAGYDGACRALGWAYEDALHKPEKDLAESLNRG